MRDRATSNRTARIGFGARAALLLLAAPLLAVLVAGAAPALAGQNGAGIWVYKSGPTTTVVNLTYYNLKVASYNVDEHDGCCPGTCGTSPWDLAGDHVGPMRSIQENEDGGCSTDPLSWKGTAVYSFDDSYMSDSSFEIVMANQDAAGDASSLHNGTWFALRPHGTQSWAAAGSKQCGRWANPVDDAKMHNVMNLINSKVMITLYSPDNKNLVLVTQQFNANQDGWNDCSVYDSFQLDFVDNSGDSVPGQ